MPSIAQTIEWKIDAATAGLTLADSSSGDLVSVREIGATREVQASRPIRSAAATFRNRRNQSGRRVFTVKYPPAASVEAARNAMEALEDSIRAFDSVTSIVEWVFGSKIHTFSSAALRNYSAVLMGLTVIATFEFVYGEKETDDV
jgi:hypothetical protein